MLSKKYFWASSFCPPGHWASHKELKKDCCTALRFSVSGIVHEMQRETNELFAARGNSYYSISHIKHWDANSSHNFLRALDVKPDMQPTFVLGNHNEVARPPRPFQSFRPLNLPRAMSSSSNNLFSQGAKEEEVL